MADGLVVKFGVDIDDDARKTWELNFPNATFYHMSIMSWILLRNFCGITYTWKRIHTACDPKTVRSGLRLHLYTSQHIDFKICFVLKDSKLFRQKGCGRWKPLAE